MNTEGRTVVKYEHVPPAVGVLLSARPDPQHTGWTTTTKADTNNTNTCLHTCLHSAAGYHRLLPWPLHYGEANPWPGHERMAPHSILPLKGLTAAGVFGEKACPTRLPSRRYYPLGLHELLHLDTP